MLGAIARRLVGQRHPDAQRRPAVHGDRRPISAGTGPGRIARANCVGDAVPDGFDQTLDAWIDPAAFAPTDASHLRQLRATTRVRGPGSKSMNLSLFRSIRLGAERRVELRVETFNLFNWVNYGFPAANISNLGTFGRITSTHRRSAGDAAGGQVLLLSTTKARRHGDTKNSLANARAA